MIDVEGPGVPLARFQVKVPDENNLFSDQYQGTQVPNDCSWASLDYIENIRFGP